MTISVMRPDNVAMPRLAALALAVVLCASLLFTPPVLAYDEAGKKKADEACAACHGPEGNKPTTPDTPRLADVHLNWRVLGFTAALACASALSDGPQRVRDLRKDIPDAGKILLHNVYGWFDRAERGIYVLTDAGRAALKRWPQQPIDLAPAAVPAE